MDVQEFDTSLSDLETRVDRLRALYENWFRGYEKAEPAVARKEVERRVYALRKELPRNTALRFRYHQLYQRYTTLTSYWQRTARQIEEGTYRLQLQRMRRRNDEVTRTLAPRAPNEGDEAQPAAYELDADASLDIASLLDDASLDRLGDALEAPTLPPSKPEPAPAAATRTVGRFSRPKLTRSEPTAGPSLKLEGRDETVASRRRKSVPSDERDSGFPTLPPSARIPAANTGAIPGIPAPKLPAVPAASGARPSLPPPGKPLPGAKPLPAPNTGSLPGLSAGAPPMRGGASLLPIARPSISPGLPAAKPTAPQPARPSLSLPAPRATLPPPAPGTGAMAGLGGAKSKPPAPRTGTSAGLDAAKSKPPVPVAPNPGTLAGLGAAKPPAPPPGRLSLPSGGFGSPPTTGSIPRPPAPSPARPSMPGASAPPPREPLSSPRASMPAGGTFARPSLAPSVPAPSAPASIPTRPTTAPRAAAPARPSVDASLGDQRMRRLYDEYAAARRKNNEGDVRFETLASSIQQMLPDLRKKHEGKQIDFEVVVKDGRVGLKPKAK